MVRAAEACSSTAADCDQAWELRACKLAGTIPPWGTNRAFASLTTLQLQNTSLTGVLPQTLSSVGNLQVQAVAAWL